ncbi:MAG: dihydroorotate dehydrogenase [Proteobacteria bacterium]|nr:MAG: dihydroorotate dehydrogenase [Pseudomonadota bacterium]PIE39993.1 MAG: dihydroorotate dehydrogenase [Gammaproteobacteria bacterium]
MKKLIACILIPLIIWFIPAAWIPIEGMTVVEHRMLAIFILAILFWVLEPVPIFATSVLLIGLQLVLISDKGLIWFRGGEEIENFGTLLSYKALLGTFSSPIIMLFLGGFFLAMAATKYRLDTNLARVFLKPFGENPRIVLLGLMLITGVFSMFISNTATTALMLAILTPLLKSFHKDDPGRTAFVLCIPFAANVGGIGTPIGTPPNAVAMKYLTGENAVSFAEWMLFGVPFALVTLCIVWWLLLRFCPPKEKSMELTIKGTFDKSFRAWLVYLTFTATILLWLTSALHGMNSYVVAMFPVVVFVVTQTITKSDLKRISWDVLWLLSGGIALGLGLEETGLSRHMVDSVPFDSFSPAVIVVLVTLLALAMSTFISRTATANLLIPIVAALGSSLTTLDSLGGTRLLVIAVAVSCSLAMALPISTPPNAMAYATGQVDTRTMLVAGLSTSVVGMLMLYALIPVLSLAGFV